MLLESEVLVLQAENLLLRGEYLCVCVCVCYKIMVKCKHNVYFGLIILSALKIRGKNLKKTHLNINC